MIAHSLLIRVKTYACPPSAKSSLPVLVLVRSWAKRRSCRSMEYFGASIQTRKAGHRHQTRSRANIMAEIAITIRLIIVLSSPAVGHIENERIRPGRAADLR